MMRWISGLAAFSRLAVWTVLMGSQRRLENRKLRAVLLKGEMCGVLLLLCIHTVWVQRPAVASKPGDVGGRDSSSFRRSGLRGKVVMELQLVLLSEQCLIHLDKGSSASYFPVLTQRGAGRPRN